MMWQEEHNLLYLLRHCPSIAQLDCRCLLKVATNIYENFKIKQLILFTVFKKHWKNIPWRFPNIPGYLPSLMLSRSDWIQNGFTQLFVVNKTEVQQNRGTSGAQNYHGRISQRQKGCCQIELQVQLRDTWVSLVWWELTGQTGFWLCLPQLWLLFHSSSTTSLFVCTCGGAFVLHSFLYIPLKSIECLRIIRLCSMWVLLEVKPSYADLPLPVTNYM